MSSTAISKAKQESLVSAVSTTLGQLHIKFSDEQRKRVSQWLNSIEDYAEQKVMKVVEQKQLKRKNPDIVVAAAVYDAFLEYESRTDVQISLPFLKEVLGHSACSISKTWKRLFDNRISLQGEELGIIYVNKDGTLSDAVENVVEALKSAADNPSRDVEVWLDKIKEAAITLCAQVTMDHLEKYGQLLIALTVVYAAIKRYHGKPMIRITQKDLSLLSAGSQAMISKCWLEIFGDL